MRPLTKLVRGFSCYNIDMEDTRNLIDEFKGLPNEEVFSRLSEKRTELEVAIENVEHDFNVGTIVRSANNFNVRRVHIIGRKKYNRRGAMCTDKYLEICHWATTEEFLTDQRNRHGDEEYSKNRRELVAIENHVPPESGLPEVKPLALKKFIQKTTLIFGSEGNGISDELLKECDDIVEIESLGSTRSVNVGVAAGIAMYEWARQCVLGGKK